MSGWEQSTHPSVKFCRRCASSLTVQVPEGDDHPRHVCDACGYIDYLNPRMIVGCLPVWEEQVLLCLRDIEPRRGYWTLPAGFMENGETAGEGALREAREEAGAQLELGRLYAVYSTPEVSQVYLIFLARLLRPTFNPTFETAEARLFSPHHLPWDQLAFRAVDFALRHWVAAPQDSDPVGPAYVGHSVNF